MQLIRENFKFTKYLQLQPCFKIRPISAPTQIRDVFDASRICLCRKLLNIWEWVNDNEWKWQEKLLVVQESYLMKFVLDFNFNILWFIDWKFPHVDLSTQINARDINWFVCLKQKILIFLLQFHALWNYSCWKNGIKSQILNYFKRKLEPRQKKYKCVPWSSRRKEFQQFIKMKFNIKKFRTQKTNTKWGELSWKPNVHRHGEAVKKFFVFIRLIKHPLGRCRKRP